MFSQRAIIVVPGTIFFIVVRAILIPIGILDVKKQTTLHAAPLT